MLSTEVTDETKSSNVGKDFQSIIKTELTCHCKLFEFTRTFVHEKGSHKGEKVY